jgi:hypothetical protein
MQWDDQHLAHMGKRKKQTKPNKTESTKVILGHFGGPAGKSQPFHPLVSSLGLSAFVLFRNQDCGPDFENK